MSFINNIQSVAKYESKLLLRSWFFRVFTVLALLVLGLFNAAMLVMNSGGAWIFKAISSNIPYMNLLLLNTGQAVIAIFLASDFLKRDKKLDTSEVFYVHSLSNAEYVIGKIWGNLRVFLILNLIIMAMGLVFNYIAPEADVDFPAYLQYFLMISLPTLIFIIGLAIFLMLVLKNQALTFIILLGYIGLTIFYIGNKFYYLFDYMAYSLPLMKSSIVGFTNYSIVLNHRAIYLFAGLAFILFTISLFNRLPNTSRSSYPWLVLGCIMIVLSGFAGYNHIHTIIQAGSVRKQYTEINNKYVNTPKMIIDTCYISLEQHPEKISAEINMKGTALKTSTVFAFCLNPGLEVNEILKDGKQVNYTRDHQIILADLGEEIMQGDTISLSMKYQGEVNNNFCYLDIPQEVLQEEHKQFLINVDKQYSFQTNDFVLFTPETYWYPRPGTSFSDENSEWQQTYFSYFTIKVKPLPGLIPLSQGKPEEENDGVYSYSTDCPAQAISLVIGRYVQKSLMADSIRFSVWHIEGHDFFTHPFDSIQDTIPALIKDHKENMERQLKLSYPFNRFGIIEVPAQFHSYVRAWSQAQETVQPEMILFPEKGWIFDVMDIKRRSEDHKKWSRWDNREVDEKQAKILTFNDIAYNFMNPDGNFNFSSGSRGSYELKSTGNPYYIFPQFYNFRYNIFSSEWPVSNRLIELYLQNKADDGGWERQINGISNNEKANLLFEKHSFKELLGDIQYREILNNIIALRGGDLFSDPEINIGVKVFRDSLYAILNRNSFKNIQFENLLDTLGRISKTDIKPKFLEWNNPTPLAYYSVRQPEITQINNRGKDYFVSKITITNLSDYDGIVNIRTYINWGDDPDPRTNRKVVIGANQTEKLVTVWEDPPRHIQVNTMISNNLPAFIDFPVRNIVKENKQVIDEEGDFIVEEIQDNPNEIIVDNEDPLFVLSEPAVVGLLPKWLDKVETSQFKYAGVMYWRPPLQWTPTTNSGYYGKYIRSAYVIKSGDGSQTATWKVPLKGEGLYEIYYWTLDPDPWNRNQNRKEYRFKVKYGEEEEEAFVNIKGSTGKWDLMGVYYLETDTVRVTLYNDSKLRNVTADAVRIIKRQ